MSFVSISAWNNTEEHTQVNVTVRLPCRVRLDGFARQLEHYEGTKGGDVRTVSYELFQLTDGGRLTVDVAQDQVLLGPVLE